MRTETIYHVIDADTRLPIKDKNYRLTSGFKIPGLAFQAGYAYGERYPERDWLVVDDLGRPVPASRFHYHV